VPLRGSARFISSDHRGARQGRPRAALGRIGGSAAEEVSPALLMAG